MKTQASFWEFDRWLKPVDIVVAGSGIVGLTTALLLKEKSPPLNILVVERGALPSGASTKNAGFACFGSISELMDDLQHSSEDEVFALAEKRLLGLERLRRRLGDAAIAYEALCGYELFEQEDHFRACADQIQQFNAKLEAMTKIKQTYQVVDDKIRDFGFGGVRHLIVNRAEGQIDTGRMMEALLQKVNLAGIKILTGMDIAGFTKEENHIELAFSNGYSLKTRHLLICTNGFARQFLPELDVQPARAQVLITDPIDNLPFQGAFHYDRGYYYFRNVGNRVLLGGGRNLDFEGETTTDHAITEHIQNRLEQLLRDMILPNREYAIAMRWAGTMGLGKQKKPIVQPIAPRISCAVRMGGMGVALGSLTGEEAAEMVLNQFS